MLPMTNSYFKITRGTETLQRHIGTRIAREILYCEHKFY